MKSDSMGVGTTLSKKGQKELLTDTKETIAQDVKMDNNNQTFGHRDLWNVQKRQKSSASMRRWLT